MYSISSNLCMYHGLRTIFQHSKTSRIAIFQPVQINSSRLVSTVQRNSDKKIREDRQSSSDEQPLRSGRTKLQSIMELMRWHKPTGIYLALYPSLWSLAMYTPETNSLIDLKTVAIFTAGAISARGIGCTINDILDRKYDRYVDRTKLRPIACGDISTREALCYLALQSSVGLYILCLNNVEVIKLGLFSGIMISIYPLFKRFTNWPQIMLGMTMNWGVLMGCAAIKGSIGLTNVPSLMALYAAANLWTLYYDTIYAHQDKNDDLFIGVKSSALALGDNSKKFLLATMIGMTSSLGIAGLLTSQLWTYHLGVLISGGSQLYQVSKIDLNNKKQCWDIFNQQKYIGLLILSGLMMSVAHKAKRHREKNQLESIDRSLIT